MIYSEDEVKKVIMGRVGKKIVRRFNKVGKKIVKGTRRIGKKLGKAGGTLSQLAPFLAAVPGVGPELSLGAAAVGAASSAVGRAAASRNVHDLKRAGGDLAATYAAHKAARRS